MIPPHTKAISKQKVPFSGPQALEGACLLYTSMAGLRIGKEFGTKLSGKASVLGGVILIGIGLEIFVSGVFF